MFSNILILSGLVLGSLFSIDIPVIENPGKPPVQRTIAMTEAWRIGDDDGADYILGVIKMVISDKENNLYLLDTQQREVLKFSPDGQYLKSISRKGQGPGEIERCYYFGFWDENTIACLNNFPHKFVRFDLDGTPLPTLTPVAGADQKDDGRMAMGKFIRRDGYLMAHGSFFLFKDGASSQKFFLTGFDDDANETICYGKFPTGHDRRKAILINEEKEFLPLRSWTLGRGGEVYTAPERTGYLIEVLDSQGNLLRKITRPWPLIKRTDKEKEKAKNNYTMGFSGKDAPQISYIIADYPKTIGSLNWVDDQLWVTTRETIAEPDCYSVDVFDRQGHLLENRSYLLPFDYKKDRIHWLDDGRAVVVTNYFSARTASRSSNTTVIRGEGKEEEVFDDGVLEVVMYEAR